LGPLKPGGVLDSALTEPAEDDEDGVDEPAGVDSATGATSEAPPVADECVELWRRGCAVRPAAE
jgi:hypothetical protein